MAGRWLASAFAMAFVGCMQPNMQAEIDESRARGEAAAKVERDHRRARQEWIEAQERERAQREEESRERTARENEAAQMALRDERARRLAELETDCAPSRATRRAAYEAAVTAYRKELEHDRAIARWAIKHCKIEDTRGVLVTRQHVPEGVVIRTRSVGAEDDLVCDTKAGRPPELNAEWIAARTPDALREAHVYQGEYDEVNERCAAVDGSAGLDLTTSRYDVAHPDGGDQGPR